MTNQAEIQREMRVLFESLNEVPKKYRLTNDVAPSGQDHLRFCSFLVSRVRDRADVHRYTLEFPRQFYRSAQKAQVMVSRDFDAPKLLQVRVNHCVSSKANFRARICSTSATSAIFDASVTWWNIDSPKKRHRLRHRRVRPQACLPSRLRWSVHSQAHTIVYSSQ